MDYFNTIIPINFGKIRSKACILEILSHAYFSEFAFEKCHSLSRSYRALTHQRRTEINHLCDHLYQTELPPLMMRTLIQVFNRGVFREKVNFSLAEYTQTDEELIWLVDFLISSIPPWLTQQRRLFVQKFTLDNYQIRLLGIERVKNLYERLGFRKLKINRRYMYES